MRIDVDVLVWAILSAGLSLLFLPESYLLHWHIFVCLDLVLLTALLYCYWKRKNKATLWFVFIFLHSFAYFHSEALSQLALIRQVGHLPNKIQAQFQIVEVLHQGQYQSFIVQAQLDKTLPQQRIFLDWRQSQQPQLGEIWQGELRLRPLSSRLNQGGFDKQQWYISKGVSAWAAVKNAQKIADRANWRQRWLRNTLAQTQGLSQQGLLLALTFGERAWLNSESWQRYQQTNTAHLIAISGLHIGLAMSAGFLLARLGQFLLPTIRITPIFPLISGVALATAYAMLAGLSVPTFRALIALLLVGLLQISANYCSVWRLFFRCLALLFVCDPFICLSSSFWLSAGAVACLILWYQILPLRLILWRNQPINQTKWRYFFALLHLQLGLFCLFMPIQIAVFGGISLTGFWANLLAVPLFSLLLVPLAFFALVTQGAWQSWSLADQLAQWIEQLLATLQEHWLNLSHLQLSWILICLGTGLFLLQKYLYRQKNVDYSVVYHLKSKKFPLRFEPNHFLRKGQQQGYLAFSLLLSLSGILSLTYQIWREPDWRIEMLDVGQGLAMLIVKDGYGVLFDTGASWQGGSMAKLEVLPLLQRQGIKLEQLILSHDDNDHSGGVPDIFRTFPQIKFISSSMQNYRQHFTQDKREFCQQGKHWQWRGLDFSILSPLTISQRAKNTDSCVLLVSDAYHSVLLTGDADLKSEHIFTPLIPQIDVLQVGHHGSKTSTGQTLLNKAQPKIALISSGRWNSWHFPHSSVVERLQAVNSQIYNSAETGQVSVRFESSNLQIETARDAFSPWYRQWIKSYP